MSTANKLTILAWSGGKTMVSLFVIGNRQLFVYFLGGGSIIQDLLPDTDSRRNKQAELVELCERVANFESDVLALAERLKHSRVDTDRLKRSRVLFESADIERADRVLDADAMTREQAQVLADGRGAEVALVRNSEKVLTKAWTTILRYGNLGRFDESELYFENALISDKNPMALLEYAAFLHEEHRKYPAAREVYEEALFLRRRLAPVFSPFFWLRPQAALSSCVTPILASNLQAKCLLNYIMKARKYHDIYVLGDYLEAGNDWVFVEDVPLWVWPKDAAKTIKLRLRKGSTKLSSLLANTTGYIFHEEIKEIIESMSTPEQVLFHPIELWDYKESEVLSNDYFLLTIHAYDALDHKLSDIVYQDDPNQKNPKLNILAIEKGVYDEQKLKNLPHLFDHFNHAEGGGILFSDELLAKLTAANATNIKVVYTIELGPPTDEEKNSAAVIDAKTLARQFYDAVNKADFKVAEKCLKVGANLEYEDKFGGTALLNAVKEMNIEGIEFLLKNGANTNPTFATDATFKDFVPSILLTVGFSLRPDSYDRVNTRYTGEGEDSRIVFIGNEQFIRLIKLFIKHGANVNGQNLAKQSPLMGAVRLGHFEAVQLLLDAGADLSLKDDNGKDALFYAVERSHAAIADLLKAAGAIIDDKAIQQIDEAAAERRHQAQEHAIIYPIAENLDELEEILVELALKAIKKEITPSTVIENLTLTSYEWIWVGICYNTSDLDGSEQEVKEAIERLGEGEWLTGSNEISQDGGFYYLEDSSLRDLEQSERLMCRVAARLETKADFDENFALADNLKVFALYDNEVDFKLRQEAKDKLDLPTEEFVLLTP